MTVLRLQNGLEVKTKGLTSGKYLDLFCEKIM